MYVDVTGGLHRNLLLLPRGYSVTVLTSLLQNDAPR